MHLLGLNVALLIAQSNGPREEGRETGTRIADWFLDIAMMPAFWIGWCVVMGAILAGIGYYLRQSR